MKIRFALSNVFLLGIRQYKKLNEEDSAVINTFALLLILSVIFNWAVGTYVSEGAIGRAALGISQAASISIMFAIFDKLGVLTPIENRIENFSEQQKSTNEKLENVVTALDAYGKYQTARLSFGFNGIRGISVTKSSASSDSVTVNENLPLNLIRSAERGSVIHYMTSFINDEHSYVNAIQTAVGSGAHVRLLLMMPKPDVPVLMSRYEDFYHRRFRSVEDFATYLRGKAARFEHLRDGILPSVGSFRLRYYTKSLNFPLVSVRSFTLDGQHHDAVYTGFYAEVGAEEMPYIEWRGGDFQIATKFVRVFETKWTACKDNTSLS